MNRTIIERQQILEAVNDLPDEALLELAGFLNYLRYKSAQPREITHNSSNFLVAVAGLGHSGQQDISERDEEILLHEVDPVYGWNLKPSNPT